MALTEDIAADQAAVQAAQEALDAATAKLAADQAALDSIQPHLSIWAEVESTAQKFGGEVEAELMALVAKGRGLFGF